MLPTNKDPIKYYIGDCREQLKKMPNGCIQTVITSPPYYGLRDYKIEPLIWGGQIDCEHKWGQKMESPGGRSNDRLPGKKQTLANIDRDKRPRSDFCIKCGAWRGQLGLEPTLDLFIEHLVDILEEVRRVLRPDGTVWLNLGDCYAGGGRRGHPTKRSSGWRPEYALKGRIPSGFKRKDLLGMPWRVALSMQGAGWYLRSDIIWAKENPMPESINGWRWEHHRIKDDDKNWQRCPGCQKCEDNEGLVLRKGSGRPTKNHEYIFLLAKSEQYYYDVDSISEPWIQNERDIKRAQNKDLRYRGKHKEGYEKATGRGDNLSAHATQPIGDPNRGRNKRTVWTINTRPYKGAHFAVFPKDIPEICIKAGTSPQACSQCGAPYARIIKRGNKIEEDKTLEYDNKQTVGWRASCQCQGDDGSGRSIVLDPFAGSGTTGAIARELKRQCILLEQNPDYEELIRKRINADHPVLDKWSSD